MIAWLIIIFMHALEEDEARLYTLQAGIKMLHGVARTAGSKAIRLEKSYNDLVSSLH